MCAHLPISRIPRHQPRPSLLDPSCRMCHQACPCLSPSALQAPCTSRAFPLWMAWLLRPPPASTSLLGSREGSAGLIAMVSDSLSEEIAEGSGWEWCSGTLYAVQRYHESARGSSLRISEMYRPSSAWTHASSTFPGADSHRGSSPSDSAGTTLLTMHE